MREAAPGAAAFICEPQLGNAGGVLAPPGYLEAAYGHVRAAGGVCIADEVQVGYARLGRWFWAFEQQAVVPDIVTIAKPAGNGHPLGAVITTPEIAAACARAGASSAPRADRRCRARSASPCSTRCATRACRPTPATSATGCAPGSRRS